MYLILGWYLIVFCCCFYGILILNQGASLTAAAFQALCESNWFFCQLKQMYTHLTLYESGASDCFLKTGSWLPGTGCYGPLEVAQTIQNYLPVFRFLQKWKKRLRSLGRPGDEAFINQH